MFSPVMKRIFMKYRILFLIVALPVLSGCLEKQKHHSNTVCLGKDHDTLIEALAKNNNITFPCGKGDLIATKLPAHFCDFNYQISFNSYNSAYCVYNGQMRDARVKEHRISFQKKKNDENKAVKNEAKETKAEKRQ